MRVLVLATILALASAVSFAQQPPTSAAADPRLSGPTIDALNAVLKLREAELKALHDDAATRLSQREKEWQGYFSAWTGEAPAPAAK